MENCFRFLINVDQCLNMSYFDIFFYRLESQHKFHMRSVQSLDCTGQDSLRSAANDIRMYLNKYPYHVGDYQIIVAMRSTFAPEAASWEETMLCRLLRLDYELRKAHILINSREKTDKALNLIMLYDADFSVDLPELGRYKETGRLQADCVRLLELVGIEAEERSLDALEQALSAYTAQPSHDEAVAEILLSFLQNQRKNQLQLTQMADHMEYPEDTAAHTPALYLELAKHIQDSLCNIQLFEQQIDRNNRRQLTLSLLRVVEFINMTTALPEEATGNTVMVPLAHRCVNNWNKIWQDRTLEQRYADMLKDYHYRLSSAASELDSAQLSVPNASQLPAEEIPSDTAITHEDGVFSEKDPMKQKNNLQLILKQVLEQKFSLRTIHQDWDTAYRACKQFLEQMEYALENYGENLSRQYAATLEKRKKDSAAWRKKVFLAEENTEADINRLGYERDQRLQQLKTPQMNPSLKFQDQLNMENALEQGNLLVQHYVRSLHAVTAGNFLLLVGICALLCFCHYTLLQTYVFKGMDTILCYLIYLAAVLVLMLLCWMLPYNYFKRRLKACIKAFQEDAEKFISGYYTKAEQFGRYINLLNQLDYITRYQRLLIRANKTTHQLSQGYLWHKVQIRQHLSKLQFFQGLIALGNCSAEAEAECFIPGIDGGHVSDFIDSPIYWPQKGGD